MTIMDKIRENNSNMVVDDSEVYIRQNSRITYDLKTVKESTPYDEFVHLVNLNKKAVEKYIGDNPSIKDKFEETARVNYTSPFLATRKAKEEE